MLEKVGIWFKGKGVGEGVVCVMIYYRIGLRRGGRGEVFLVDQIRRK